MKKELPKSKMAKVYMFHEDCPTGEMFNPDQVEGLEKKGWVDTPARLNLPENLDTGVTEEELESMGPEELKQKLEGYGFIVITQEQLQAEANKMAAGAIDIAADHLKLEDLPDEKIIDEVYRRNLDDGAVEKLTDEELHGELTRRAALSEEAELVEEVKPLEELSELDNMKQAFNENPKGMDKQALCDLGNDGYKLGLRMNMKPETLIAKITDAMNNEE